MTDKLYKKECPAQWIYVKKLFLFALPISANMLFNMLGTFIAVFMLASLGKNYLAAVGLASTTFTTVMTLTGTIFSSVGILISHQRGQANNLTEIGSLIKNSFYLAFFFAISGCLLLWNMSTILLAFGQNPQLVALTKNYFHFAGLSLFPLLLSMIVVQFYIGIGKPRFALFMTLLSLPFLITASYAFILGKLGMPKMGLAGISFSMLIIALIRLFIILVYLWLDKSLQLYNLFSGPWSVNEIFCKKIIKLGFPISIQFGGELAAMTAATYLMGYFGATALAASQIVSQYSMLIIMIILGLSQAVSILISKAYGEQDSNAIRYYFRAGLIIQLGLFILVSLLYFILPKFLISLYLNLNIPSNQPIINLAIIFFFISAIALLFDGLRNYFSGALRGLHNSKTPMWIGLTSLWCISLPFAYIIAYIVKQGPIGVQVGFTMGYLIGALMLWLYLKKQHSI